MCLFWRNWGGGESTPYCPKWQAASLTLNFSSLWWAESQALACGWGQEAMVAPPWGLFVQFTQWPFESGVRVT